MVSADIKLEIGPDVEGDEAEPAPLPPGVYHPDNALVAAIKDWIPEFSKQKTVWKCRFPPPLKGYAAFTWDYFRSGVP